MLNWITSFLPNLVKQIAEGDKNAPLTKAYWWLAGKKTITALAIAFLYGVAQVVLHVLSQCAPACANPEDLVTFEGWLKAVPTVVGVLVGVGLFDKAVRLDAPKKQ